MEEIQDRDVNIEYPDRLLRDQFVENLRDEKLQVTSGITITLEINDLSFGAAEQRGSAATASAIDAAPIRQQAVYASAKNHLEATATSRERHHSTAPCLLMGTRVYRKSHPLGRHKIQDHWEPTVYKVVRCLDDTGAVYHISPEDGLGSDKNIHCTELRVIPSQGNHSERTPIEAQSCHPEDGVPGIEGESEDDAKRIASDEVWI
ncbi:hypothetical protein AAFF_G00357900 [Aldrovandia affinis]|uniref:Uncharacterized protein n=1 Tax=Aldrovandia affinis TaxID=143900 RepID=A0AAD7X0Z6_9TELE|nr:hypothetical protein AAFF_G00357900 [Aldrovandia affinis]